MRSFSLARIAIGGLLASLVGAVPLELRAPPTVPTQDPFYAVPDDIHAQSTKPGTILKWRRPPNPIAAFNIVPVNLDHSFQLQYKTTDNFGNATASVVTVLIPNNADYGKVLSHQVAEDASYANCAPSYVFQFEASNFGKLGTLGTQAELLLIQAALQQGWIVISPDHEGPKGAWLANKAAGHAVLDGIRAALGSSDITGIRSDARVTMQGYSGGSVASMFAAELQPSYAPEVEIAGASLGGTVPVLFNALKLINRSAFAGLIASAINGVSQVYPEIDKLLDDQLRPSYKDKFRRAKQQCLVADIIDYAFLDIFGMVKDPTIFSRDPARRIMEENSAGQATPQIPLFIYKSVNDEISPVADTDSLVKQYCADGAPVEYVRDIVSEHGSLAITGPPISLSWLKRVMNGWQPKRGCSTRTVASTLLDASLLEVVPEFLIKELLDLLGKRTGPAGTLTK